MSEIKNSTTTAAAEPSGSQAQASKPLLNKVLRNYPPRPECVYLMGTCLVDSFYSDAGMDAIQLLKALGVEVIFPQDQSCCGQPAYNSGYDAEARAVARLQLKAFSADIPVVVMMGSCAAQLHKHYPDLFAGEPEEAEAIALAQRTYEFSEFLISVLGVNAETFKNAELNGQTNKSSSGSTDSITRVALHTSCSSRRSMQVAEQHKALVQALPNVELVEPERVTECCGFGGTFAVKQPDISAAMAHDKALAMAATGADLITSADCGCMMNIGGTLEKLVENRVEGARVMPVKHLATLAYEALSSASASSKAEGES